MTVLIMYVFLIPPALPGVKSGLQVHGGAIGHLEHTTS